MAPINGNPSSSLGNLFSGGFILTCCTGFDVISPPINSSTISSKFLFINALNTAGPHQNGVSGFTFLNGR